MSEPNYATKPNESPSPAPAPFDPGVPPWLAGPAPAPSAPPQTATSAPPAVPAPTMPWSPPQAAPTPPATPQAPQSATPPPAPWMPPSAPVPAPAPVQQAAAPIQQSGTVPAFLQGTGTDSDMTDPNATSSSLNERIWIPKGGHKYIIFLSDGTGPLPYGPPVLYEHQTPIGQGKTMWSHFKLCLEPLGIPCDICQFAMANDGKAKRYKGMFFSVLDLSEWTDKKGVKHSCEKKLLVAKKDTAEKLGRKWLARQEQGQSLRGAMFKVYRGSTDKSPSVGDDFEFVKMVDLSQMPVGPDGVSLGMPMDLMDRFKLSDIEYHKKAAKDAVERMRVQTGTAAPGPAPVQGANSTVRY